jgi:two-component system, OmpR family, sensor kinase
MRNLSVTTFIHILFLMAIAILIATFLFFVSWDEDRRKISEISHYKLIADAFLSNVQLNPTEERLESFYRDFSVKPIPIMEVAKLIQKEGQTIFSGTSIYGKVRVFRVGDRHFIYVQRLGYNLMLKDDRKKNYNFQIATAIGIFLVVSLLILYLAILKKLYPLKRLHHEIERFAAGEMDVKISYKYGDEIGKIAKNFSDAIARIEHLSASKNLFMRNIMHELKTPITKGRIIVEMLEDEQSKMMLIRAFERMNELITELAQIERVTAQGFAPDIEAVMLDQIVAQTQDLLMTVKANVIVQTQDRVIRTDPKLFALALKNLLDNGIKYSPDGRVVLRSREDTLEVLSQGEPLKHPLAYYIEPFSQEEKRNSGFGLGLYIVNSIVEKLGHKLQYRYESGTNIFSLLLRR